MDHEQHEYLSRMMLVLFLMCLVGAATGAGRGVDTQTVKIMWFCMTVFGIAYMGLGLAKKGEGR